MRRTIHLLLTLTLTATVLVMAGPVSPAGAATPPFYAMWSPLDHNGTDFTNAPPSFSGNGALYVAANGEAVFASASPGIEAPDISGDYDIHVGLAFLDFGSGPLAITVHVEDGLFDLGPWTRDCAGLDTMLEAIAPDGLTSSNCQAFKQDYLSANGAGANFEFNGYGGFTDSSGSPVASSPDRASDDDYDDAGMFAIYYQGGGSAFTLAGVDYSASLFGTPGSGANWLPAGGSPYFLPGTTVGPLPLFPSPLGAGGGIYPVHAMLIDAGGRMITMYVDGALFSGFGGFPEFTTDCPGFEDFLTNVSAPGISCVAFLEDLFTPPSTVGDTYTCTDVEASWTDENGDPMGADHPTVADGFDPPSLTPYGVTDGPGVCVLSETVEPPPPTTTPPTPTSTPAPTTPPPSMPPIGSLPTSSFGPPPSMLPATGSTSTPVVLAALVTLTLGLATIGVRRRLVAVESDLTELESED